MGNFIHEVDGIKKKEKKGKKREKQQLEVIHSSSHFGVSAAGLSQGSGREQWLFNERSKIVILIMASRCAGNTLQSALC